MAKPVGKLKKINLNEVWSNEVDGFASWLQQEEILEMLGEVAGIIIEIGWWRNSFGYVAWRSSGQRCEAWPLCHCVWAIWMV